MQGALQLAAIVVAALTAGCATSIDISCDATHDFAQDQTWEWLPRGRNVNALPGEERGLATLVSRLVDEELEGRGLARVGSGADLVVGFELRVRRQVMAVNETGAQGFVSSHHASPSYEVQATTSRIDVYDKGYLWVVVTDGRREQRVWWGELWARRRGSFARHLPDLVPRLLARLPAGNPPGPAGFPSGCR